MHFLQTAFSRVENWAPSFVLLAEVCLRLGPIEEITANARYKWAGHVSVMLLNLLFLKIGKKIVCILARLEIKQAEIFITQLVHHIFNYPL